MTSISRSTAAAAETKRRVEIKRRDEITDTSSQEEASQEVDVSSEWEDMLSVEEVEDASAVDSSLAPAQSIPTEIETFARHSEPASVLPPEHEAQDLQAKVDEKIQEARFYISQQLFDLAKKSVNDLAELSPDAPEINELMSAVSAGQSRPTASSRTSEAFAASAFEPPPLDFLPPPFSAPVPQVSMPVSQPEPESVQDFEFETQSHAAAASAEKPAASSLFDIKDPLLDVETIAEAAPRTPVVPTRATQPSQPMQAAKLDSTEDILGDFLLDLEQNDLADFAPQPKAESTPAIAAHPAWRRRRQSRRSRPVTMFTSCMAMVAAQAMRHLLR